MNTDKKLISNRMVIIPLPAALRVRSTPEQFPTMTIYQTGVQLLGRRIPFSDITELELTEDVGIRFNALGRTYHYAAISGASKETPDEHQTGRLFNLLIALKQGGILAAQAPLEEFISVRRATTRSTVIAAIIMVIICAILAWWENHK